MRVLVLGRAEDCLDYRRYCDLHDVSPTFLTPPPLGAMGASEWLDLFASQVEEPEELDVRAFDDVISFHDGYQVQVEILRARQGRSSRDPEALACLTDKSRFKSHGALTGYVARHIEIDVSLPPSQALTMVERSLAFPVVIKPSNGFYSAGVVRVDEPAAFARAMVMTKRVCNALRKARGSSAILVEEYLDGDEFAVDGFAVDGKVVPLLRHQKHPRLQGPYFHETAYITQPFDGVRDVAAASMLDEVIAGVGLDCSPFHAEFRYDAAGRLFLLEIAPRLAGGGATSQHLLQICSGLDAYGLLHQLGRSSLELVPLVHRVGLEYDAAAEKSGFLRRVEEAEGVCRQRRPSALLRYCEDGEFVLAPPLNAETVLTAFFDCASVAEAEHIFEDLQRHCVIETDMERT